MRAALVVLALVVVVAVKGKSVEPRAGDFLVTGLPGWDGALLGRESWGGGVSVAVVRDCFGRGWSWLGCVGVVFCIVSSMRSLRWVELGCCVVEAGLFSRSSAVPPILWDARHWSPSFRHRADEHALVAGAPSGCVGVPRHVMVTI